MTWRALAEEVFRRGTLPQNRYHVRATAENGPRVQGGFDEITFGPFSVRGGFVVREKINNAAEAEKAWSSYTSSG